MSNSEIIYYDLEDILPIHLLGATDANNGCEESGNLQRTDIASFENSFSEVPGWVEANLELGKQGEDFVKQYLESRYNAVVTKVPDINGYDFECVLNDSTFFVEVKSSNRSHHFYISHNEMKKAKEHREKYHIYFLAEFDGQYGRLFDIQDPYELFGFEQFLCWNGTNNGSRHEIASVRFIIEDLSVFHEVNNIT